MFKLPVDEYAILSTNKKISEDKFISICKIIIELIELNPFIIDGNEIIVSITGGISLTHSKCFINADTALKKAKDKNKDFLLMIKYFLLIISTGIIVIIVNIFLKNMSSYSFIYTLKTLACTHDAPHPIIAINISI